MSDERPNDESTSDERPDEEIMSAENPLSEADPGPDEIVETDDGIEEIRDARGDDSAATDVSEAGEGDRASVTEDEPRAEGEFAADGEFEAADAEPIPGSEPDEAGDALVSRLRLIEDQELTSRAESLGQVHDELRSRLESGDSPSRPV